MSNPIQTGTLIYHFDEPGEVVGYTEDGKLQIQLDHGRYQEAKGPGKLIELSPEDAEEEVEVVEHAPHDFFMATTEPGVNPPYSPYGYIVTEDGKVHTLLRKWCHGIVLSILFPDHAKSAGYRQPDRESNVYHYQRYELDHHNDLPVVRIAFGVMTANALSKGYKPATEAQIQGARLAFSAVGLGMRDEVSCDYRDMPLAKALEALREDESPDPAQSYEATAPEEYKDA